MTVRYLVLAADFDGTIARDGQVAAETLALLRKVTLSGRRVVLVTGRRLDDLQRAFPDLDICDWIVAENGALLYRPASREEVTIAPPVNEEFIAALRRRKVEPLSVGRVIVATWQPHETTVLETIRDLGLELQVIFNKGAVMVLPAGVNKAMGLNEALQRLGLSAHEVVGIGDAENDHAFLRLCELSAAVANALPLVKENVDFVTRGEAGAGVRELARQLLKYDLRRRERRVKHLRMPLGKDRHGREVAVPAHGSNLLFVGSSGGGKSSLAKAFLEQLADRSYQFCVIDPEGDYEGFEAGAVLGDRSHPAAAAEVLQVLKDPRQNVVVNLLGVSFEERPAYFASLMNELLAMRGKTGRPHWIIVDEAHHVLPKEAAPGVLMLPEELMNVVFITVEPESMLGDALTLVDAAFAVGDAPDRSLAAFAKAALVEKPEVPGKRLERGEAVFWRRGLKPRLFRVQPSRFEHRRHQRKYAEGDLGPEASFYFRGPKGQLNLKAQNLIVFSQLAAGLDDDTWTYHLKRGDYTRWFRDVIKDDDLASEAANLESARRLSASENRARILDAIARLYTLPSSAERSSFSVR
jgi:HAD superfamily hydrolase (TIGR01484 family)